MNTLIKTSLITALVVISLNINANTPAQKANFIMSIVRQIEWPSDMRSQPVFRVAVYGSYDLYRELIDELMGRSVYNKNIEVLNLTRPQDFDLANFHIVYVAEEACNKTTIDWINSETQGRGSLIMSEKEGGLSSGAAVNFINRNGKLQFEVSQNNARNQGLKVTTNLINFAANKS